MVFPTSARASGASVRPTRATGDAATVAGLALAVLLGMTGALALSPLLPLMASELGNSVAALGQAIALLNRLAAALGLLVGPVGDQLGPRRVLLGGLLCVAGSAAILASAPSAGAVVLGASLGALSRAAIQPMAFAIAAERFDGD